MENRLQSTLVAALLLGITGCGSESSFLQDQWGNDNPVEESMEQPAEECGCSMKVSFDGPDVDLTDSMAKRGHGSSDK